jgi:hypothetical protein
VRRVFAGDVAFWTVHAENARRLIAYIHNNSVRAGIVVHARDSEWTSHQVFLGAPRLAWLDPQAALARGELDTYVDANVGYVPVRGVLTDIRRAARRRGAIEVSTASEGNDPIAPLSQLGLRELDEVERAAAKVIVARIEAELAAVLRL